MISSKYRRVAVLSAAPLAAGAIFAASAAPAFAAPSGGGGGPVAAAPASSSLTTPVTGLVNGVASTGTLTITQFVRQAGQIVALGNLNLGGQDLGQVAVPVNLTPQNTAAAAAAAGSCPILHLDLGPLDLNLLGLVVHLDEVVLDITAQSGSGNLLGNLLCAVAGLLDGPSPLGGITALLNNILRAL